MNTPELINFLNGPISVALGTTAGGKPWFTRVFGVAARPGEKLLRVFVPKAVWDRPRANIERNDRIALTCGDMSDFQTKQFKGRVVDQTDASEEDLAIMEANLKICVPLMEAYFGPECTAGWRRFVLRPAVALTPEYTKVYDQTPGPSAGKEID